MVENESLQRLMRTQTSIEASVEGRKEMKAEASVRRMVEGDFDPDTQKLRAELAELRAKHSAVKR